MESTADASTACPDCGAMVPRQHLEMHQLRGCPARGNNNSRRRPREPTTSVGIATSTALADNGNRNDRKMAASTAAGRASSSTHQSNGLFDNNSNEDDDSSVEYLGVAGDTSPSWSRNGRRGLKSSSMSSNSDSGGGGLMDCDNASSSSDNNDHMNRKPRATVAPRRQHRAMSLDSEEEQDSKPPARRRRRIHNSSSAAAASNNSNNDNQAVIDLSTGDSPRTAARRVARSATAAAAPNVEDLTGHDDDDVLSTAAVARGSAAAAPVISIDSDDDDENEQQQQNDQWACTKCTLLNPSARPNCEACGNQNPNYVRPPDASRREQLVQDDYSLAAQLGRGYRQNSARDGGGGPPTSPMGYAGIGGLVGAAMGAAGNWAQGRDPLRGALEGGTTGAFGGALLHQAMQMDGNARDGTRSTVGSASASTDVAAARSSAAMGVAGYPSGNAMSSNSRNGSRPRTSFRMERSIEGGREVLVMHDGNGTTTRMTRTGGNIRSAPQDQMELLLRHYAQTQALHGSRYGNGRIYALQQHQDIDNMNYEQMLRAFGNGTENMGAEESIIRQLPTHKLKDPLQELPEDARQCAICLEDFEKDETRMCLPCFHGFHEGCCEKWLRQNGKCPVCQHRVGANNNH